MIKKELEELESRIMEEVVRRRKLGGYDANAETILYMTEWLLKITQHLVEQISRKK